MKGRLREAIPMLGVLVLVLAFVLPTTFVLNHEVDRHERRALQDQTTEIRDLLSVIIVNVQASLTTVGVAAAHPDEGDGDVETLAAPLLSTKTSTVVVVRVSGNQITTLARVGAPDPALDDFTTNWRAGFVRRALEARSLVTHHEGDPGILSFAVPVPGAKGVVAYQQGAVGQVQAPSRDANSPYRNLAVSLFSSSTAQPSERLFGEPRTDGSVSLPFPVGADTWTVVARPTAPLDGELAADLPIIVGVGGGILAVLVAITVGVLSYRRRYADSVAKQRTVELVLARAEAEAAKDRAEAASEAKSEFLSRMSHELRTPLNAILGFGQLLAMDDLSEKQRRGVDQILGGGNHLLALINEVLDLARIESGRLSLSMEPVAVSDVLDEARSMVSPVADGLGIELRVDSTDGLYVLADRQRVLQIVLNLLSNAVKYNRPGGHVALSARPLDGRLRIEIRDTGAGIHEDQHDDVFTPFERLPGAGAEGTGIGLALSRRLAEAMGATVDFTSIPGTGSTFWVECASAAAPTAHVVTPGTGGPITVLYVDDNPANRRVLREAFELRPALRLRTAKRGSDVLGAIEAERPGVILLDLGLPDISGEDVLAQLQADPVLADIPVAVVSAHLDPSRIANVLRAGADAFLSKPLDINEVLKFVERAR